MNAIIWQSVLATTIGFTIGYITGYLDSRNDR